MATELAAQHCEACTADTPRLSAAEVDALRGEVSPEWRVVEGRRLARRFEFKTFKAAFAFATGIADIAEAEGHHPDMRVGWGYVEVELTTHATGGLSRNDFIVAAKIEALPR